MKRVLIVCTVHNETGNATAEELHWVLGLLRPHVLFLEHPSANFSTFLDESCYTLELMLYRKRNVVELVPVDLPFPVELKQKFEEMFNRIEEASPRYCWMDLTNRQHTEEGGLAYLNSPASALLQAEMKREMRTTVDILDEPSLTDIYAQWTHIHELRELAMIKKVEAFAQRTAFNKGILLVGAAHRESLSEKLRLGRDEARAPVAWEFDWQLEETAPDSDGRADGNTAGGAC
jgi:hypothetical protein